MTNDRVITTATIPEPRLHRELEISFKGDWGMANLTQVARWLQQEVLDRCDPGSRGTIHSGRGGADECIAAGERVVDIAITTPAAFARMAVDGTGPFAGRPYPGLRALATIPQDDRLLFVAAERLAVATFDELARHRGPWTLGSCADDGVNFIGYAVEQVLARHGLDRDTRRSRGVVECLDERPPPVLEAFRDGRTDVIAMEGISIPVWEELWRAQPGARVLAPERAVLVELEQTLGWPSRPVTPGWWSERSVPEQALDFSDFLVITHADLPDDVAHLVTWCLFETRDRLERSYRHLDPRRSGVTHPLRPHAMSQTAIPLHEGARRYLVEAQILA